jgi:hypothetical protein
VSYLLTAIAVLFAPVVHVAAAPMFPLHGAQPDAVLLALFAISVGFGPRFGMAALAPMALLLSFLSGRDPALLIAGYIPMLPFGYFLEGWRVPLNRFFRSMIAVVACGMWARFILAAGAYGDGATFSLRELTGDVLIPGAILDAVLVALLSLPLRLAGVGGRSFSPARTGWFQ